jgi:hypothetical protein
VRFVALGCVLLASGVALAQPAPVPVPAPEPIPGPAPDGTPVPGPAPATPDPTAVAPAIVSPAPTPAPTAVTVPVPGRSAKQTATEERLAAAAKCAAHEPCDWLSALSSLERQSLRRTLASTKLELDPLPWGKVIERVEVINEAVFAEKNWLRFFNLFHATTRPSVVRSEVVVESGEVWTDERVLEAARRVRDPLYTSVVVAVPVKTADPNTVVLLVVTRDIWSLRLNTKWDIQGNSLLGFTASLSENNFLGRRKTVAFGFTMDQGAISTGPLYIDKNFLREHIDLRARVEKIFTRKSLDVFTPGGMSVPTGDPGGLQDDRTFNSEGTAATVTMSKVLWSLSSKWGYGGSVAYRNAISRSYFFTGLRSYDDPTTPEVETLPREHRMRTWSIRASITRQWGDEIKHALEMGYSVGSQRPSLLDTPAFQVDPLLLQHFREDVFPRDEVVSSPFIEYSFFWNKFTTVRNIDTYELAEDIRFGPNLTAGLSQTFKTLGSTNRFTRPSLSAGWSFPWGRDGFARISAGGQLRIQDGNTVDNTATASVRATTPTLSYVRLIGQLSFQTRWNDRSNLFYTLGSESGLRAYNISQFSGGYSLSGCGRSSFGIPTASRSAAIISAAACSKSSSL